MKNRNKTDIIKYTLAENIEEIGLDRSDIEFFRNGNTIKSMINSTPIIDNEIQKACRNIPYEDEASLFFKKIFLCKNA